MRVLAIETSCDETGVAIVDGVKTDTGGFAFTLLGAAALNSQAALHAAYGGVYPSLAKREHEKNLPIILEQALRNSATSSNPETAKESLQKNGLAPASLALAKSGRPEDLFFKGSLAALHLDAIAVTQGPGLEPALWTGITFAMQLAKENNLPLLLTNHMEGHLISSLARSLGEGGARKTRLLENIQLPVLALLISGGHTEFDVMDKWFRYEVIGQTQDDAVGEAYDKVARMLGLPYPGGPEISKLADSLRRSEKSTEKWSGPALPTVRLSASGEIRGLFSGDFSERLLNNLSFSLPRPMLHTKDCNVSFSGLKTAVLYRLRDVGGAEKLSPEEKATFAREFEDAVGDVFAAKTHRALEESGAKSFVIGGGVAANRYLRERLQALITDEFPDVTFYIPELSITGDNAIMIAEAALARALSGLDDTAEGEVRAYSNRFSITAPK